MNSTYSLYCYKRHQALSHKIFNVAQGSRGRRYSTVPCGLTLESTW